VIGKKTHTKTHTFTQEITTINIQNKYWTSRTEI